MGLGLLLSHDIDPLTEEEVAALGALWMEHKFDLEVTSNSQPFKTNIFRVQVPLTVPHSLGRPLCKSKETWDLLIS